MSEGRPSDVSIAVELQVHPQVIELTDTSTTPILLTDTDGDDPQDSGNAHGDGDDDCEDIPVHGAINDGDDGDDDDDQTSDDDWAAGEPVKWEVLLSKVFYFWLSGAYSCVSPFLPVFYDSLGFTKTQVGLLTSLQPFLGFFGGSLGTALADKTRRHKVVFGTSLVLSAALRLSLLATTTFSSTMLIVLGTELFGSPVFPLLDNSVLEVLRSKSKDYGKIRLWGAVGWGIFAAVVGWIITQTELRASFISYGCLMVVVLLLLLKYPMGRRRGFSHPEEEARHRRRLQERREDAMWLRLARLFGSFPVSAFFFTVFILGYSMGSITTILFIHLKTLGATELLMGLSISMTCVAEVPFFFFFNRLLAFLGVRGVLYLSFFCYVVRLLYYSFLSNPWWVLPAELLHGVTYAASWSACVIHAQTLAPKGLEATMQGLLTGTHWGIGVGVGSLMSGILYQYLGAINTFRVTAGISFAGFVFYFVSNLWSDWRAKKAHLGGQNPRGVQMFKTGESAQNLLLQEDPN